MPKKLHSFKLQNLSFNFVKILTNLKQSIFKIKYIFSWKSVFHITLQCLGFVVVYSFHCINFLLRESRGHWEVLIAFDHPVVDY